MGEGRGEKNKKGRALKLMNRKDKEIRDGQVKEEMGCIPVNSVGVLCSLQENQSIVIKNGR